jgi:hypothetical protein
VQADWTFILLLELPMKELCHLPRKMPPQSYQTSLYMVPHGSTFPRSSDGKMNVQSACALTTLYLKIDYCFFLWLFGNQPVI